MTAIPILVLLAAAGAALVSCLVAWLIIRHAVRLGLQDLPNARSSHQTPRPRGGGVGIVLAFLLALPLVVSPNVLSAWQVWLLLAAALALGLVGLMDDLRSLGLAPRLASQALAVAALASALAGGVAEAESDNGLFALVTGLAEIAPRLSTEFPPVLLGALDVLTIPALMIAALWWINLFNFMDGIDGLAASQAFFMLTGALLIQSGWPVSPTESDLFSASDASASLILAAAVLGFLVLNWPPARIFMGDAGSLFLGFAILAKAAHDVTLGHITLWTWLVLGSLFLVDATMTLARRFLSRQRVTTAHRSHAYQRLSRRWGSHRRVTLVYCLLNVTVVLPLAFLAHHVPQWAPVILSAAWLPASVLAWRAGAGLKES